MPLDVGGEALIELAPLALADAVDLFTRRATAQRPRRDLGEPDALLDLCRSLDGLPLAIELAAARTRTLSVEEITRRLDDRFEVLRDPTSRKPERRRALGATIRWSYDLLFPDDQRGLWALATFAGGGSLGAVEFVLDALSVPSPAAIDIVGRLASRSLVIVDEDQISATARATGCSTASAPSPWTSWPARGSRRLPLAADARWFADAAASSTDGVRSSRQTEHLSFARTERANIDAAVGWAAANDPRLALAIVNGFGWAWVVLGDSRGAQRVMTALHAAGDAAVRLDRGTALLLGRGWRHRPVPSTEREHIADAIELADAIGDDELRRARCYYLAYVVSHDGQFEEAIELTDRSRALYADLDRPWDQAANARFAALGRRSRPAIGSAPSRPATGRPVAGHDRRPVAARPPRRHAR